MIYVWQFGYLLCFDLGILIKFISPSLYALLLEILCIYLFFFSFSFFKNLFTVMGFLSTFFFFIFYIKSGLVGFND